MPLFSCLFCSVSLLLLFMSANFLAFLSSKKGLLWVFGRRMKALAQFGQTGAKGASSWPQLGHGIVRSSTDIVVSID